MAQRITIKLNNGTTETLTDTETLCREIAATTKAGPVELRKLAARGAVAIKVGRQRTWRDLAAVIDASAWYCQSASGSVLNEIAEGRVEIIRVG